MYGKTLWMTLFCAVLAASAADIPVSKLESDNAVSLETEAGILSCRVVPPKGGVALTLPVEPGAVYTVSAELSGDVPVECVAWSKNFPGRNRRNLFVAGTKPEEFRRFSGTFAAGENVNSVRLNLFAWQRTGSFRLRNLSCSRTVPADPEAIAVRPSAGKLAGRPCVWLLREGFSYPKWQGNNRIDTEPSGWDRVAFGGAEINAADRLTPLTSPGTPPQALEVNAPETGLSGWICNPLETVPGNPFLLRLQLRRSGDFSGARPVARIHFLSRTRELLKVVETELPAVPSVDNWSSVSTGVTAEHVPPETAFFQLFLGCRATEGKPRGKLWFDMVFFGRQQGFFLPRADRFGGWYHLGETVTVTPAGKVCAPEVEEVIGIVRDSQERELQRKCIPAEEFRLRGWFFLPDTPGFYLLDFRVKAGGREIPVTEEFSERSVRVLNRIPLKQRYLPVAVASVPRNSLQAGWLGFSIDGSLSGLMHGSLDRQLPIIRALGGSFVRFHGCIWPDLEPERGKFNFFLDDAMRKLGPELCARSVLNVWGTPRWASSLPGRTDMQLNNPTWKIVKPARNEYTREFWSALVNHYRKFGIRRYEVWNEPHLPGFSCFWNDTPEHFAEMLADAASAIRGEDAGAEIWLGGIGQRYLPFYDRLLELGARKYFDAVPLHGRDYNADTFRSLDRKHGVASPVYTSSEWHTVLISADKLPPNPESTEREISKVMLLDLLRQKRSGVREVTAFGLIGWIRKEGLRRHLSHGNYRAQAIGIFESVPYIMPRHCALVLEELAARFPASLDYDGEFRFGAVRGARFRSGPVPILIAWHDEKEALECPEELKKLFSETTRISDWEGREIRPGEFALQPEEFYYLSGLEKLPLPAAGIDVLSPERPQLALQGPAGVFGSRPIIDADGVFLPADAVWNERNWGVRHYGKPFHRRSRFALAVADGTLQLAVETSDERPVPAADPRRLWLGDSLQFAFDTAGSGHPADCVEFALGELADGSIPVLKLGAPPLGGDLPGDYTVPGSFVGRETALRKVEKIPGGRRYLVRLKQSELYPLIPAVAEKLRFSLLINENDGSGRIGYHHWADGIGNGKDPVRYGTLLPPPSR
ncbi:hypothetical protein FYJ85_19445 [Victivallaceae bacterium BBE-744-WT-12]|uniref:Carbohydrate binding protein with CBM9 domain n=1 Tax=Victivallis lenta TaxID=2606640 RepID=A0A844G769_9BACT|nr:hypothetical protein [Victivallis lenta]MST99206.1 hypothetical protein [Victivallis lenta]